MPVGTLIAAMATVGVCDVAFGLTFQLQPLILEAMGIPAWIIGINAAMGPLGILLIGPFLPRIIAGFGGKILTQVISRNYYPAGTSDFSVLATKFGYAAMRDVIFTSIREFYPDIAAHYIRKHRAKVAALSARDTQPPASN